MTTFPRIILSSGKDQSIRRFHPWVFSGAIKKTEGELSEGDIVEVYTNKDEYLGTGHYQKGSISVRVFSFKQIEPDNDFWYNKLKVAYDHRTLLGLTENPQTNVYRLVFAEGDGLPGLIIDFYKDTAVIQTHSIGMHLLRDTIAEALQRIYGEQLAAVYDKSFETLPERVNTSNLDGYILGHPTRDHFVLENGNKFHIDWKEGQKTGFFVDQRENRKLLAQYSQGKNVLNAFCYTGAFSVYALAAGAEKVVSVDSSKRAIDFTNKNIALNEMEGNRHEAVASDVFDFLKHQGKDFDVMVLDPPAFAKHHDARHHALMGYKRLNTEAFSLIKPGGIVFTFSCSQVVDKYLYYNTITSAAINAGRQIKVLHHLTQPPDHPVSIFHPEGEYLKGLVLRVE